MGIDPGLGATGYGVLEASLDDRLRVMAVGDLRPPRGLPLAKRLAFLHEGLSALIAAHRPAVAVLEKLFTHHRHVTTAAMMGHARGVACLAVQERGVALAEYPPTQVKKSLTGRGNASKEQVARMVGQWVPVDGTWSSDATDALALALVHAHLMRQQRNLSYALPHSRLTAYCSQG